MRKKNLLTLSGLIITTALLSSCTDWWSEDVVKTPVAPVATETQVEAPIVQDPAVQDPTINQEPVVPTMTAEQKAQQEAYQKWYEEIQKKETELNKLRDSISNTDEYKKLQEEFTKIPQDKLDDVVNRKKVWEIQLKIRAMEWDDIRKLQREIRIMNEKMTNPELANNPDYLKLIDSQEKMWDLFGSLMINDEYIKLDIEMNKMFQNPGKPEEQDENQKKITAIQDKMKKLWSPEMIALDKEIQELSMTVYNPAQNQPVEPNNWTGWEPTWTWENI